MRDASDLHAAAAEVFGEIKARGIALHICAQGENNLPDRFARQPRVQLGNAQILRSDSLEWRNLPAKDMIAALKTASFLNADDVHRLFDHTHQGRIAARIRAKVARNILRKRAAGGAASDSFARVQDRLSQLLHGRSIALHQTQRDPFGGTRADAWQPAERRDEGCDRLRKRSQASKQSQAGSTCVVRLTSCRAD